ncbi:MAG: hypothetical protein EPO13_00065 [Actinomycetota bacterium]|nr:MAG: hypothetical protein EPO13_00065 [Actinomycetota bacterium]
MATIITARRLALLATPLLAVGAVALTAGPASAGGTISGTASCDETMGTYVVTWTLANHRSLPGTVWATGVSPGGTTLSGIGSSAATATPVPAATGSTYPTITVLQTAVPGTSKVATLTVSAAWPDGHTGSSVGSVPLSGTCCPKPSPTPTPTATTPSPTATSTPTPSATTSTATPTPSGTTTTATPVAPATTAPATVVPTTSSSPAVVPTSGETSGAAATPSGAQTAAGGVLPQTGGSGALGAGLLAGTLLVAGAVLLAVSRLRPGRHR